MDLPVLSTVIREYSSFLTQLTNENKNDILLGQLMLMAIGEAAKRMQTDFSSMLLTALKPVLEKAGNPDFCEAGVQSLQCVADALALPSISQLLEDNAGSKRRPNMLFFARFNIHFNFFFQTTLRPN